MPKKDFKKGDVVKVISDWYLTGAFVTGSDREKYGKYIGQVGIIIRIFKRTEDGEIYTYYVEFHDRIYYDYKLEDLEEPTEKEIDRYYLMRYKYV